jgi:hypothetical protein
MLHVSGCILDNSNSTIVVLFFVEVDVWLFRICFMSSWGSARLRMLRVSGCILDNSNISTIVVLFFVEVDVCFSECASSFVEDRPVSECPVSVLASTIAAKHCSW